MVSGMLEAKSLIQIDKWQLEQDKKASECSIVLYCKRPGSLEVREISEA